MSFLCCWEKWHPNKLLVFTSGRITARVTLRQLVCGSCLCHAVVTVKCDIAYSAYIAQMFLIHCQPAVALQVNYHLQRSFAFLISGSFYGRYRLSLSSVHLYQENKEEKGFESTKQVSEILDSNKQSGSRGGGLCYTPGMRSGS